MTLRGTNHICKDVSYTTEIPVINIVIDSCFSCSAMVHNINRGRILKFASPAIEIIVAEVYLETT
jgi:hypothetical protein